MNDVAEAVLTGELERDAEIRRQPGHAAADDDRIDERVELVDEVRGEHGGREVWATQEPRRRAIVDPWLAAT